MKATLIKIKSNHNSIENEYEGIVETLPKIGEHFVMFNPKPMKRELRMDDAKVLFLKTTPVTAAVRLSDKVIEFETKNSKYSLEFTND